MRFIAALAGLLILTSRPAGAVEEPRVLTKVTPLPLALSKDFRFRKTKLFFLGETDEHGEGQGQGNTTSAKAGKLGKNSPSSKSSTIQEASIRFERQYRLYGAVTALDRHQRYGHYFDFFWSGRRPAAVTVRLEYRQEKLHSHVQAQEISYANVHGTHKTEFRVVGDDYFDDGRVIAWRCLLIENGAIVAEDRSYLWE
jgi:hypothetical protein